MSEGREPHRPTRTVRFWSADQIVIPEIEHLRVAEGATRDIAESVRRNLERDGDSDESIDSLDNVVTQRSFPFGELDSSLIPTQTDMARTPTRTTDREVDDLGVDTEIERLRTQLGATTEQPSSINGEMREFMQLMQDQMRQMREQMHTLSFGRQLEQTTNRDSLNVTYGRTDNDVRNRHLRAQNYMQLKEARGLIPEFDGTSQDRLHEFLNAIAYAANNINPAEEPMLLEAILCTKLKGVAMIDFEHRDIQNFEQLRNELETGYSIKQSTAHLQIEFNSLKQKADENAQVYGRRTEKLAMQLFESMVSNQHHTSDQKRAMLDMIRRQALQNFQIGLHEDIKTIVRAQNFQTLQEAVAGAVSEEKLKGTNNNKSREKGANSTPRDKKTLQCHKCGKLGHFARECRSTKTANKTTLPKAEGLRVNAADKHCVYCKRNGHVRDECWKLHGRPTGNKSDKSSDSGNNKGANTKETEGTASKTTKNARDFQVNQLKEQEKTGLDLVVLPIVETKRGKIPLLFDTGSSISLVRVRTLKGDTPIIEDEITLTGITGHEVSTIGRFTATIKLGRRAIQRDIYVVRDDFPTEYEGILGADFLRAHSATFNYRENKLNISGKDLTLIPHRAYRLPARTETIVRAVTNVNTTGIVVAEERRPGIIIGNGLVTPKDHTCAISIINTTEDDIKIAAPYVTVEEIPTRKTNEINSAIRKEIDEKTLSRIERVNEQLRLQHLNAEERKAIREICTDYSDIFFLEGDQLTCTMDVEHQVTIKGGSAPANVKPYRLPEKHKREIDNQIHEMLKNEVIRPSSSQWNAPLLVVPKKPDATGKVKLRVVVDFRKLNDLTIGDSFPLPNITDILDQLGSAKYFTTLDLASGYHQIQMAEEDKQKTAFSTTTGHYEFNRMPFGLKNAPATFQRLMNTVLAGLQGIQCLVYLDDIVVYGASLQDHNKKLIAVLKRLRQSSLKLQPNKCEFLRKEVTYLGHIISENGVAPDPAKLEAVRGFPRPTKVKDIQAFIGLAGYYRRFIENFSQIARPLTKLTKKDVPFDWNQEQEHAFTVLKTKLTTSPILKYPDFSQEFLVTTDASDYAIGAVLSQGKIGKDNPIAYASRVLSRAEQNYNTTEKELLAIVWAVKHFRPYVYGTKFKIITDHKPLIWLFNVRDPGSRLIRWRLQLEEYDYEVLHKAGRANANADALSRQVALPVMSADTRADDNEDNDTSDEAGEIETEEDNACTLKEYTGEEKQQILYEFHDAPLGGHQGVQRTLNRIRMHHTWKNMAKDIKNYISKCELCQKNKLSLKTKMPLVITDTPSTPFEKCALDIVGPLTVTRNGNRYLLTFQDNLTKFSKAIPMPDQEATTVAREFIEKIVLEYGIPKKVLTDQGTNFLSNVFKSVCKLLKIEKIQTSAYHPQSNGALERTHRTFAEYLRHYIDADQTNWDDWIPYATFTFNTTPHTSTRYSPFELLFGHKATLPSTLASAPAPTYTFDDYAQELKQRLRATNQVARMRLIEEKEKSKKQYDKSAREGTFLVGDKVLLFDETVRRGRSKKLDAKWIGPYEVTKKLSDVTYALKKGRGSLVVHANRLKLFIEN